MRRLALAVSLAIAVSLIASDSAAFRISGTSASPTAGPELPPHSPPPLLHFDLREFASCVIPYTVNPANNDGLAPAAVLAAADASFAAWSAVAPAIATLSRTPATSLTSLLAKDDESLVYWGSGNQDDVQVIPVGNGEPGATCVTVFGGGSVAGGDDMVDGIFITTGANGICESLALPGDYQSISMSQGQAYSECVGAGVNQALETSLAGDDNYGFQFTNIESGPDGICDTTANSGSTAWVALTANFHDASTGVITESDIVMNDALSWNVGTENPPLYDIQVTLTHEAGHFLGFHHSEVAAATMDGTHWPNDLSKRSLHDDDRDAMNFVYTPDLGDAPGFPTIVHGGTGRYLNGMFLVEPANGAQHVFGIKKIQSARSYTYEWIGNDADAECDPHLIDLDPRDDGVTFSPPFPVPGQPLLITTVISTDLDAAGGSHDLATTPLYLNIWIDWNGDDVWSEGAEHVEGYGTAITAAGPWYTLVLVPESVPPLTWVRVRLDWGEDAGQVLNVDGSLAGPAGAAQFGEVEDYPLFSGPMSVPAIAPWGAALLGALVMVGALLARRTRAGRASS